MQDDSKNGPNKKDTNAADTRKPRAGGEHHGGVAIGRAVGVMTGGGSKNVAPRGSAKDEPKPSSSDAGGRSAAKEPKGNVSNSSKSATKGTSKVAQAKQTTGSKKASKAGPSPGAKGKAKIYSALRTNGKPSSADPMASKKAAGKKRAGKATERASIIQTATTFVGAAASVVSHLIGDLSGESKKKGKKAAKKSASRNKR